jgi:surfeit locus 1 family protein
MIARLVKAKLLVPTLLSAFGLAILIGLGTWQLNRKIWKEHIQATLKARGASSPIAATGVWPGLPCFDLTNTGLTNPCEYQPLHLRGTFDHGRERHIFTAAPNAPGLGQGRGYWVFTPMLLEGSGKTVFVNRGFVPEDRKEPAKRVVGQTTQPVEITGLYRSAQERAMFDGQNDAPKNIWYVRNPSELWAVDPAGRLDEMWAYVDQTGPVPAGGYPLPLAGKTELSNRHLEYAITWYGLALTLLGVYGTYAWGRIKPSPPAA